MARQSCMHCYVSGRVQGVWFRASAKEQAEQLELDGWTRNLADGRVEVFACGDQEQLELFYAWLQQGPQHAIVSECRREDLPWEEVSGFKIVG